MTALSWHDAPGRAPWHVHDVYCLGKNYRLHAIEMGQKEEKPPVVFLKPAGAIVPLSEPIRLPKGRGAIHHELELVCALSPASPLRPLDEASALRAIAAVTVGLDLTLRDEQSAAKSAGEPWTASKGFPASGPTGPLVSIEAMAGRPIESLTYSLSINGKLVQEARAGDMIVRPAAAVERLSALFAIIPGDLLFTGTPHGVGPLLPGDELVVTFGSFFTVHTTVEQA